MMWRSVFLSTFIVGLFLMGENAGGGPSFRICGQLENSEKQDARKSGETPASGDWPQFRGPQATGVFPGKNLPTEWDGKKNLQWKTALPGAGTSSPVILGKRIFLTCYTGYGVSPRNPGDMDQLERLVLCLDRDTGKILWKQTVKTLLPETVYEKRMHWHGYASSTPVVDSERLYCFFGKSGVFAFDHDGKQLWQTSVGENTHEWGSAASPVLYKDLVIINAFVESGDLVALNKKTGKEVWRLRGLKESWNTPLIVPLPNKKTELVVGSMGKILGVDPDTGKQLWSCSGPNWYIVGSMVAHQDIVFVTAGRQYGTYAIRAGGRGDVSDSHLLWKSNKGSNVSSAVYHDGNLYVAHESQGLLLCFDAATGNLHYNERLPNIGSEIYASPLIAGDNLYITTRQGMVFVIPTGNKFSVLAQNRFAQDNSIFNASPAVSHNLLFIRSDRFLYCLAKK